MGYSRIREAAYRANMEIVEAGLVLLTWGNASARDPEGEVYAIKPSGVAYKDLSPEAMVILSIARGNVVEGELKPSSDAPTHTELYRAFPDIGGVVHTHSHFAVVFAQARRPVPILGTTHADHFRDDVPVTRSMSAAELADDYEAETGRVIVERFRAAGTDPGGWRPNAAAWAVDPRDVPSVLVANHGPFSWGPTAEKAVENAIVLEEVARMAYHTATLGAHAALKPHAGLKPHAPRLPRQLSEKHFLRKHGPGAYYGQSGR
jgi:L-ribulose-5-phosphate 4-epimerase